jgi:hypothetical protein
VTIALLVSAGRFVAIMPRVEIPVVPASAEAFVSHLDEETLAGCALRLTPIGTAFSDLHAVLQAWQPMQRVWSMTFPHCTASVMGENVSQRSAGVLAGWPGRACPERSEGSRRDEQAGSDALTADRTHGRLNSYERI